MPNVATIAAHPRCRVTPRHRVVSHDVAEVHHFFTGVDSIRYEDQGFAQHLAQARMKGPVADGR